MHYIHMKKLIPILFFIALFTSPALAQRFYQDWPQIESKTSHAEYSKWAQKNRDSIVQNNIHTAVTYVQQFDKNGNIEGSQLRKEEHYDSIGDIRVLLVYNHKGQFRYKYQYTYSPEGIPTNQKVYNRKGKFVRGWHLTLNSDGLITKREIFAENENNAFRSEELEYNADARIIKKRFFDKKGRTTYTVEYDYYPDGNKQETRTYNKKGKLKNVVKYDCLPTGTLNNGRKADTTTVCNKSVYDADSNRIETYEIIKQNGKVWRSVNTVNKKGQYIAYTYIDPKEKTVYDYTRNYTDKGIVTEFNIQYYGRRSKHWSYRETYEYTNNGRNKISNHYNYKNRLIYKEYTVVY